MQREEDGNSDDSNTSSHLCSRSSTVAGDGGLDAEEGKSFGRDRPHDDNDTFSVETSQLQRAGQMELVVNTNSSNEAPVSIAQCSDQTLALATVLASSLLDHGEGGLPRVDMPRFRPAKILDKGSGMSGV
jgi:hypothetical protein